MCKLYVFTVENVKTFSTFLRVKTTHCIEREARLKNRIKHGSARMISGLDIGPTRNWATLTLCSTFASCTPIVNLKDQNTLDL